MTSGFLIKLCTVILFMLSCGKKQESYQIVHHWTCQAQALEPVGDINGDGKEEFFKERENDFTLVSFNNAAIWQRLRPQSCLFRGSVDKNLIFSLQKSSSADLGLLENFSALERKSWNSQLPIKDMGEIINGRDTSKVSSGWDGRFSLRSHYQVGGQKVLLFSLNVGLDAGPKGLLALDGKTYKELWRFLMGPTVDHVIVEDLNADQIPKIVVGTYGINNFHSDNGSADTLTYVFVLNQQGKLLWSKVVGGKWEKALVGVSDFNQDGHRGVIVVEQSQQAKEESDSIMIFEGETGKLLHCNKVGEQFLGMAVGDINHDGRDEIIVGNTDGVIRAFNSALEVVAKSDTNLQAVKVLGAADLDGDGSMEVVASSEDGSRFFVLNNRLCEISSYQLNTGEDSNVELSLVNVGRHKGMLFSQLDSGYYSLLTFQNRGVLGTGLNVWSLSLAVGALFVFLVGGTALFVRLTLRKQTERVLYSVSGRKNNGVLYLDSKKKIRFVNDAFCNLLGVDRKSVMNQSFETAMGESGLGLFQAPSLEKVIIKTPAGEKNVAVYTTSLGRNGLLIQLEDASREEYARKLEAWAPVAQRLAHGVKNPLSHIRLAVQQLRKLLPEREAEKADRYSNTVMEEVNRLIKIVDGFMKFTDLKPPTPKPTNVNEVIERLLGKKIRLVLSHGVTVEFVPSKEIPPLNLDENQIGDALINILDNALFAVGSKGAVTINTVFLEKVDKPPQIQPHIEIQISDTGAGIPKEYLDKLFQPYFSTKPEGTGLGLCITKKIVEDHGGTIRIDSKSGLGTTVIIQLPVD